MSVEIADYMQKRLAAALGREAALEGALADAIEALRFYADPKSYEVQHSKDRDVCNSMRCGCSLSPVTTDDGDTARAILAQVEEK